MRSFAAILSMTAPVPPAHLSFIETILRVRPRLLLEHEHLGVVPAQFDHGPRVRMPLPHRERRAATSCTRRAPTTSARAAPAEPVMKAWQSPARAGGRLHLPQHVEQPLGRPALVTPVVAPDDLRAPRWATVLIAVEPTSMPSRSGA